MWLAQDRKQVRARQRCCARKRGNPEQQELSSDARRRGETSNATETFAYLGIHAGEAFVGTLQDPGLLHVNTRHCLGKRLREQQRAGRRDIVNASRVCAAGVFATRDREYLMLHRQASVTIIIGSTKRHCPNWRRSAERFAFGIAAQLRAATRDFPVHDRLHASQTPKGCSFTGLPPPAGMGSPYRMDDWWAAGDSGAVTTAGGVRPRHDGTMVGGHIVAIPKQTYDLDRSNRFLVGNLPGNRGSYTEGASYCWRFG
ncbi:Uncharacterized protein DBV15_01713 [Temnothorax longispinosus]|uniref:Uncharacterized protein n=1 Tax=Temnothorax longispinosus TaxID=300112 RepID=A0A4S2L0S0_9HYME|nr:Uncharacterized protein DBV15_01713 [Temnothorax longispinosus]